MDLFYLVNHFINIGITFKKKLLLNNNKENNEIIRNKLNIMFANLK